MRSYNPIKGEGYCDLRVALGLLAGRRGDKAISAYDEWRDCHYGFPPPPDLNYPESLEYWRRLRERHTNPLIWNWRSPFGEFDQALRSFQQAYENDALTGSGRTPGGQRKDIAKYEMLDLQLCDRGDGPHFYDSRTSQLAIMNGEAEPAYYDMRFRVADVLKAISAEVGEALEAPLATGGETAPTEPTSPRPASEPLMRERAAEKLLQLYPEGSLPKYPVMLDDLKKVGIPSSPRTLTRAKKLALELRARARHATPG
jgi:hypothetical protein